MKQHHHRPSGEREGRSEGAAQQRHSSKRHYEGSHAPAPDHHEGRACDNKRARFDRQQPQQRQHSSGQQRSGSPGDSHERRRPYDMQQQHHRPQQQQQPSSQPQKQHREQQQQPQREPQKQQHQAPPPHHGQQQGEQQRRAAEPPRHKVSPDVHHRDQGTDSRLKQQPQEQQQQPQQKKSKKADVVQQQQQEEEVAHGAEPNAAPKSWRAPQPLSGNPRMPAWVDDCFTKDEMALVSESVHNIRFLREGVAPAVGMSLYLQMTYEHDGSHAEAYRGWARMVGRVTHVYEAPEVGLYAVYDGQSPRLTPRQLDGERWQLPALPPSLFGSNAICGCCRTAEQVVAKYGAVHGQRIKAEIWLSKNDAALGPQLGGVWEVELICNDNLQAMWVVCAMQHQAAATAASAAKAQGPAAQGALLRRAQHEAQREEAAAAPPPAGLRGPAGQGRGEEAQRQHGAPRGGPRRDASA